MKKMTGIFMACPAYGWNVNMQTMLSVYQTQKMLGTYGIKSELKVVSAADIEELRNLFITVWYDCQPQFSHMLFFDADMGWPPELVRDMIWFNKPVTGVLYAKRQSSPVKIVGGVKSEHDDISKVKNGFLPAEYMGGGVMMIARTAIDEMLEKMPEIVSTLPSYIAHAENISLKRLLRPFDKIRTEDTCISEDVSFCERVKKCGMELWVNVSHDISHIGPFDYHICYQGILEKRTNETSGTAIPVHDLVRNVA